MRVEIKALRARRARMDRTRIIRIATTAALWLAAFLSWPIALLWPPLVFAAGIATFDTLARSGASKDLNARIALLESAARRNAVGVYRVQSKGFVELGEIEDDPDGYVFELENHRLVFVRSSIFYRRHSPCLDFSVVHYLGEADAILAQRLVKHTARAKPVNSLTTDAAAFHTFDHFEVVTGRIGTLESLLARNYAERPG